MLSNRFCNDGKAILNLNQSQLIAKAKLQRKLETSVYRTESVFCLCGHDDFEILAEKDRYGLPLSTVICRQCGQLMSNPRLDNDSNVKFYQNEYRPLHVGLDQADEDFYNKQYRKGLSIVSFTRNYIRNNAKVLEIGCGAGGIVGAFEDEGYTGIGVDLGERYLHFGRQNGLNLLCMSSQQFLEEHEEKFDLIILSHVFEHFLNIKEELETINKLLSNDGLLYIEVPGIEEIKNTDHCDFLRTLQLAHTYHFSFESLTMAMARFGFRPVVGNEFIQSLFKPGVDGSTKFTNQYQDIMRFLQDLEVNRDFFLQAYSERQCAMRKDALKNIENILMDLPVKSVAIYGTGEHTKQLLKSINYKEKLLCIISNKQDEVGSFIEGVSVNLLSEVTPNAVIISSNRYQEAIYRRIIHLREKGIILVRLYH